MNDLKFLIIKKQKNIDAEILYQLLLRVHAVLLYRNKYKVKFFNDQFYSLVSHGIYLFILVGPDHDLSVVNIVVFTYIHILSYMIKIQGGKDYSGIPIHSDPFPSIPIYSHPFPSILIHSHPFPFILIHSDPFSSIPIHSHLGIHQFQ